MAQNINIIDLLPNSLLFKFISLIPFKEAARTSILSKRWLHLWKHSTNVEFNEHYFSKSYESSHQQRIIQRRNFVNFMAFWIENNKENFIIEKFSLRLSDFDHEVDCEILEKCVDFATKHGVKDLVLDFSDPDWTEEDFEKPEALFELPTKVYEQKALKSLKLFSCSFVETELIRLSALREISFAWMELKNDAIKILLSNCKMIESLTMKKCWISTKFECRESNSSLKRIVVDSCNFVSYVLAINVPNLIYFKYYGNVICFELENSIHMEEVDLDFGLEYEFPEECGFIYNIITNFSHVKALDVCSYTLQVLSAELEYMLIEYEMNTRHLKLKTNLHNDECQGVSLLLENCRVLEILTINLGFGKFFDHDNVKCIIAEPLSSLDDSLSASDGKKGVSRAYSEDATLKSYPNCETVPCNDYEAAFKLRLQLSCGRLIKRFYQLKIHWMEESTVIKTYFFDIDYTLLVSMAGLALEGSQFDAKQYDTKTNELAFELISSSKQILDIAREALVLSSLIITPNEFLQFVNCMKWMNGELAKKNMVDAILEKKNPEKKKEMSKADVALALMLLDYAASGMKEHKRIESEIHELKKCQRLGCLMVTLSKGVYDFYGGFKHGKTIKIIFSLL
ncbi:hypothetical protein RYX36_016529 [Vicia faba]